MEPETILKSSLKMNTQVNLIAIRHDFHAVM